MKVGVIHSTLAAMRKAPSHKSEMVNQLLFGEHAAIVKVIGSWMYIESAFDGCSGWIEALSVSPLGDDQLIWFNNKQSIVLPRLCRALVHGKEKSFIHLVPGSLLPSYDGETGEFHLGDQHYQLDHPVDKDIIKLERAGIVATAYSFLHSPFLWGGRSPYGIDSAGLIQVILKIHGISIPRDIVQQVARGLAVNFIDDADPGDLVFFDDARGEIVHAGIIVEQGRILHAYGKVRIDKIDHQGIFREDRGEYTHRLRVVKNIIASA